jgi:hypothetical protein
MTNGARAIALALFHCFLVYYIHWTNGEVVLYHGRTLTYVKNPLK